MQVEPAADRRHADPVLVQQLRDAVEAAVLASSQQKVADATNGMSRQAVGKFLRGAKEPGYRLAVTTAEDLARAIGYELVLQPKAPC